MVLRLSEDPKVRETFNVFDTLKDRKNFVVAFSGGKDSTLLSILFYEWLVSRNQKGKMYSSLRAGRRSASVLTIPLQPF